ncbi:MAG: DEAD/DEAH box helicase [Campylobacterota bacterium]|nr:DEAD/DEAH box helicase [Campylobacterota bacterium]
MESLDFKLEELYAQRDFIQSQIEQLEIEKQSSIKSYITLGDAIYIDSLHLSKNLQDELKLLAQFDNPQVKILENLRKPLYNIPRVIKSYEQTDTQLILPRGLMRNVIELFKLNNLDISYVDKRFYKKEKFPKILFNLRDQQQYCIDKILKKDFSLCIAPPGFGKTLIGAKIIELRSANTLVIVNKNMLLDQWIDRFVNYFGYKKKDIGYLGKSKNCLNNILDVATMQSLKNNIDIIKNYSFVIVDECHHIPALTFEKIIKSFQGKFILGLSATPNRKDGMQPLIYQQLGGIAYEVKSKKKSTNKVMIIESDFQSEVDNFADLLTELINNDKRNDLIIQQIVKYKNRKVLLLTDRIEHIENLELILKSLGIEFVAIHGSLKKKEQIENMKKVSTASLVLATTSYFGEGIDFPHLNTVIFATPISYYGRLVQYLGRIGRDGSDCLAIDILDIQNRFTLSSYKKRKDGYKQLHYIRTK